MNRLLARQHIGRDDVVAAERAPPDGVRHLLIATRERVACATPDSA